MDEISELEKIKLLLAEHSTLRTEIIARTGHGYQLIAVGSSGLALLISLSEHTISFFFTLSIAAGVLSLAYWFMNRDIFKAASRIREIEIDVNQRVGEDLLVWENLWGGAATGYWGPARPLSRSRLATQYFERTFRGLPLERAAQVQVEKTPAALPPP